jgi:hypothetical protein
MINLENSDLGGSWIVPPHDINDSDEAQDKFQTPSASLALYC